MYHATGNPASVITKVVREVEMNDVWVGSCIKWKGEWGKNGAFHCTGYTSKMVRFTGKFF